MRMQWTISLQPDSRTPKYQQLINSLVVGIEKGGIKQGDRLPSINELSEQHLLSKETVERAYHELHHRGLVVSVARRGYFVSEQTATRRIRVLLLVGEITTTNQVLYQSLLSAAGRNTKIDVFTYGYRTEIFREVLDSFAEYYHHVVLVPDLIEENDALTRTLLRLANTNLIVLGQNLKRLPDDRYLSVTTNIGQEFYQLLNEHLAAISRYDALNLILPDQAYIDTGYITAFRRFGEKHRLRYHLSDSLAGETVQPNQLYITVDDTDLVEAIRQMQQQDLVAGRDVGIISLRDSCLHELLAGGITAVANQPESIGYRAGKLLRQSFEPGSQRHWHQPIQLIRRATF